VKYPEITPEEVRFTVIGFGRMPGCVRVTRNKGHEPYSIHESFLEEA
jgi:hypothetical protein